MLPKNRGRKMLEDLCKKKIEEMLPRNQTKPNGRHVGCSRLFGIWDVDCT